MNTLVRNIIVFVVLLATGAFTAQLVNTIPGISISSGDMVLGFTIAAALVAKDIITELVNRIAK